MKNRIFFRIAGFPVTQDAIPLSIIVSGLIGMGLYTGVTRLLDRNYIRSGPTHSWKNR
ncbi:hypothetical protein IWW55_005388 [Coemansia sp. RSA 2706]|nr:hypothetical protein IWW55_005388 [Coemansia sp. RSA 2706]